MKCPNCNQENPSGAAFCIECGTPLPEEVSVEQQPSEQPLESAQTVYTQPSEQPLESAQTVYTQPSEQPTAEIPPEYKPIGLLGYIGYEILFCIPCIGWIASIILSIGVTKNINLKNLARAHLCLLIIGAILSIVLVVLYVVLIGGAIASLFDELGGLMY